MDVKKKMKEILEAESKAIQAIPVTDDYERAVDLIVEHVHRRSGKLVTSVMGDVLVVNTMLATGFTREQYALRQHGGCLEG